MDVVVTIIAIILYMILGAGDIYFAVHNFKRGRYFTFGAWVMAAISAATYLVKHLVMSLI